MEVRPHNPKLAQFAQSLQLSGLTEPTLTAMVEQRPGYSASKGRRFLAFQQRINEQLLQHPVITANHYTAWFSFGRQTREQVRAFVVQFSVFSNQFLVAQLQKMINADTLEGMRVSKEILANEIGVSFNAEQVQNGSKPETRAEETDAPSVTEGSVNGGIFRFKAAHFEWLMKIAGKVGLGFADMGRRCHATPATLFYCDELIRLYGNSDYRTSQAASYAVENWAAAGFWDELSAGLERYNRRTGADLPLGFFTWHSRIESQHALHTQEELEVLYFSRDIDEDDFIRVGNKMLDGVAAFWDGLDEQRRHLDAA